MKISKKEWKEHWKIKKEEWNKKEIGKRGRNDIKEIMKNLEEMKSNKRMNGNTSKETWGKKYIGEGKSIKIEREWVQILEVE